MKKKNIFLFVLFPFSLFSQPKIQLQDFASGFTRPVDIAHCGDSRLFVVEQAGYIWILDSLGNRLPEAFLNIDARVRSTGNEQGLLGLAFPPDYAEKGYFYVNYTRETDGDTRVSRFSRDSLNPNKADPDSELILFTQDQPFANHNGGCLKFGPDGYLYIALGDGGSGGDPQNNGQKKNTLLGKILRLDVSNSSVTEPYAIPADNPFVGNPDYRPEIWSLGWRNPWRFSFDRLTGDLWVGDVGQGTYEEIDFEPANTDGLNYGWRCNEGLHTYNTNGCLPASNYISPIFEYSHGSGNGCSVTGGFVYRGVKYPDLYGCYLFADYCSGRWWYTRRNADGTFTTAQLANLSAYEYSSFGEDKDGELYVTLLDDGKIQKIKELCSPFQLNLENIFSPVCANSLSGYLFVNSTGGTNPVTYSWSNGQAGPEPSIIYLNPGIYTVAATDGAGCVRRDTFEIEQLGPGMPVLSVNDTIFCEGQNFVLTASNLPSPHELKWFKDGEAISTTTSSDTTFVLAFTEPGVYQVQIMDSVCSNLYSTQIFMVESEAPAILVENYDNLSIQGNFASIQWVVFNYDTQMWDSIPGATGLEYQAPTEGLFSVRVIDLYGCELLSPPVGIASTALPPSVRRFSLAPNPTGGNMLLDMELDKTEHIAISLSDTQQRQLFMQTHQIRKISLPIDLRALPAGTYFLNIRMESGRIVRQVLKH